MTPAAKTQARLLHHQPRQIALAHGKVACPLGQRLPLGGLLSHGFAHHADFRVRRNRQLKLLLRLLRDFIKQHINQPGGGREQQLLAGFARQRQDQFAHQRGDF
ncbi:hypothetical protein D3C71_1765870 [compost metagenome]